MKPVFFYPIMLRTLKIVKFCVYLKFAIRTKRGAKTDPNLGSKLTQLH